MTNDDTFVGRSRDGDSDGDEKSPPDTAGALVFRLRQTAPGARTGYSGFRIQGWIQDMGFRAQSSEFRVGVLANIDESRRIIHDAALVLPDYRGREASSAGA